MKQNVYLKFVLLVFVWVIVGFFIAGAKEYHWLEELGKGSIFSILFIWLLPKVKTITGS